MIMLPYLLSALYYVKLCCGKDATWFTDGYQLTAARIFAISWEPLWHMDDRIGRPYPIPDHQHPLRSGIFVYIKGRKEKGLYTFRPYERNIANLPRMPGRAVRHTARDRCHRPILIFFRTYTCHVLICGKYRRFFADKLICFTLHLLYGILLSVIL